VRSRFFSLPADPSNEKPCARVRIRLRLAAGAALLALALLALSLPRGGAGAAAKELPARTDGVLVVDLSGSVTGDLYPRLAAILRFYGRQAGDDGRLGLVLFSDEAQEALPPAAPVAALGPVADLLSGLDEEGSRAAPSPGSSNSPGGMGGSTGWLAGESENPWAEFSGGTRISRGLELALEALRRDGIADGRVILISDLLDSLEDEPYAVEAAAQIRKRGFDLEVVELGEPSAEKQEFRARLHPGASLQEAELLERTPPEERDDLRRGAPVRVLLIALLAAALAAVELLGRPLAREVSAT
jgi:hypothetical protein